MRNYKNHIEILDAIESVRSELPACADSEIKQAEVMARLANLYSCLNVTDLKCIVGELGNLDKRGKIA